MHLRDLAPTSVIKYVRLIVGFAVAPLTVGLVFWCYGEVTRGYYFGWSYFKSAIFLAYPAMLLFGVPLYLLVLEPRRWRTLSAYALSGAAIGFFGTYLYALPFIIIGYAYSPVIEYDYPLVPSLIYGFVWASMYSIIGMFFGALAGLVFWVIAIWRAPVESA